MSENPLDAEQLKRYLLENMEIRLSYQYGDYGTKYVRVELLIDDEIISSDTLAS